MAATIIGTSTFEAGDFAEELAAAPGNLHVGTRLWFENEHIKVWEVRMKPGERGPFHAHTRRYFWVVVDGGFGRQRTAGDGVVTDREYHVGDTNYSEHTPEAPLLHDFQNIGETEIRFMTVELLD
jgi:beta-alanine degradation protein BauB